jgi:hypothetical protein
LPDAKREAKPRIRLGRCLIAHTLRSTHLPTAFRLVVKTTTVLQLVDELRTMTDAEQWLILAVVALLAVPFTGFLGLAVVLVTRTIGSIGRRAAGVVVGAARFSARPIRDRATLAYPATQNR